MIAQMLFNFDKESGNSTETGSFGDAAGKWFDEAASWASSLGVVAGSYGQFNGAHGVVHVRSRHAVVCLPLWQVVIGCLIHFE